MTFKPVVVVYRDQLLPRSQTFIKTQAEALERYSPYYVGSRLVPGITLPVDRTSLVNTGGKIGFAAEAIFKLWGIAPMLKSRLKRLEPVIVHAHFGTDAVRAMPLARHLGVPLIVTFRGFEVTMSDAALRRARHLSTRQYPKRRASLMRQGRLFLAVSNFLRERLLLQGFPPNRTFVHYNGVDVQLFQPNRRTRREPIVLFVGRLVEKKGCHDLIEAMRTVEAKVPSAELVVVGEGHLSADLRRKAAILLSRSRFLGALSHNQVKEWMNRARVLSVPYKVADNGDTEGLPNVFVEAQAMGLPIVSFAIPPVEEAVSNGETAFLVPEGSVDRLSTRITELLLDDERWCRMSEAGRWRACNHFDLRVQTRKLEAIYDSVRFEVQSPT